MVVRHNLSGSADLSALVKELEGFTARTFPSNVVVRPTGESILYNNAADYVAVNEVTSFAFTFVVIGIIHAAPVHVAQGGIPLADPERHPDSLRVRPHGARRASP